MPIYEFRCNNCGTVIEKYLKVRKQPRGVKCEHCGGSCRKLISAIGRIDMNPGPLTGVDDTDELTLGKIIANKGMPAEHKRQYAEEREKRSKIADYEKGLNERAKQYGFDPED